MLLMENKLKQNEKKLKFAFIRIYIILIWYNISDNFCK